MRKSLLNAAIVVAIACALDACGGHPTSPTKVVEHARVTATLDTQAQRNADGTRDYTVIVHLAETGGVGATINSVHLTFLDNTTPLGETTFTGAEGFPNPSHLSAHGSLESWQLISTDPDPGGPNATRVQAVIAYTDDAQQASSVTQSGDVPGLPPPPPAVSYRIFGTVKNDADNKPLGGATVTVLDGSNSGRAETTAGDGTYSVSLLTPESFTVRFDAAGHQSVDRKVVLSKDTQVDVKLKRASSSSTSSLSMPSSMAAGPSGPARWKTSVR